MTDVTVQNKISTVGELLSGARIESGLTLADIAADICVRRGFLEAIEANDFGALPNQTFAVGFVSAYAKALGMDARSIAAQFKQEYLNIDPEVNAAEDKDSELSMSAERKTVNRLKHQATTKHLEKNKWPGWLSPVAGLIGATASWMFISAHMTTGAWYAESDVKVEDAEIQQLAAIQARYIEKDGTDVLALPQARQFNGFTDNEGITRGSLFLPAANADVQSVLPVDADSITLHANEDSWLQLTFADGSAMWSGVLRAGQDYTPRIMEDVFLTTSNAGGVFMVNGQQTFGPIGERGEVIAELALNSDMLSGISFSEVTPEHHADHKTQ